VVDAMKNCSNLSYIKDFVWSEHVLQLDKEEKSIKVNLGFQKPDDKVIGDRAESTTLTALAVLVALLKRQSVAQKVTELDLRYQTLPKFRRT
jgi:hypothetical protein